METRDADELCALDATDLARRLRAREISARDVVDAHLDRIDRVNPQVNAIITLDAEGARAAAKAADDGPVTGPLHGLPIAFKDTHDTAGMRTTYGSPLHADNVPAEDELVVARIRAAGAIRIGKTNVPEFAAGSHTFNTLFGATRNPYDRGRSAGGSSGGAAASLAARLQPIADGSDLGGSLRNPAAFCNVVGFRPTPGRVPALPSDNLWDPLGTSGPMGRTVADVALLFSAIAGPDPRAPLSLETPGDAFRTVTEIDLRGLRVAWSPTLGGLPIDPAVSAVLAAAPTVFTELGALVEEATPDLSEAEFAFRTLRANAFDVGFGASFDERPDAFKPALAWNIEQGRALTRSDVGRAVAAHSRVYQAGIRFFDEYDVLLAPVTQVVPFDVDDEYPREIAGEEMHSYLDWMRAAYHVTTLGAPAISVPAGFTPEGLPVGLQIVTKPRSDLFTLQVASAFEAATHHGRRTPTF
ncbi:amidase [Cryptosporangium phraense]|uniref:Amidase n=1 Tax=Cryptosporangium phraense TaxID=2593070 RepID=A0A545AHW3_9ACTN|nr:amidase [Cryptosporangium phraense]TQS40898.1 amidase [Cryptosporangium phraense]